MKRYCKNCRYALKADETEGENKFMCRRYSRYPIQQKKGVLKTKTIFSHPIVDAVSWCGEWRYEPKHLRWD